MIHIGVDPGNRMGVAVISVNGLSNEPTVLLSLVLTEARIADLWVAEKVRPWLAPPCHVWIENPDAHVMATRGAISPHHRTNVMSIYKQGVAAGVIVGQCLEAGVPFEFIAAGRVKELIARNPSAPKEDVMVALRLMGIDLPLRPNGLPDPECADAIAIAIAGSRLER